MYKILAIDGGGFRGVIPAVFSQHIEGTTGRRMYELFDLFAGTSTGAILASGLVAPDPEAIDGPPRHTIADILRAYRTLGTTIFARAPLQEVLDEVDRDLAALPNALASLGRVLLPTAWVTPQQIVRNIRDLVRTRDTIQSLDQARRRLSSPLHDVAVLQQALNEQYGDLRMNQTLRPLLLTAYDLESRSPKVFDSQDASDGRRLLFRCAASSASAPTFFAPVRMSAGGLPMRMTDGGVSMTNPSLAAVATAVASGQRLEDIVVVSLGTGRAALRCRRRGGPALGSAAVDVVHGTPDRGLGRHGRQHRCTDARAAWSRPLPQDPD